jgi:hypothetical protein
MIAAIAAPGSSAVTWSPRRTSAAVAMPVPAPISSTRAPGCSPVTRSSASQSASG